MVVLTVANITLTKEKDHDTNLTNEVRGEKAGDVPNESGNERQIDGPRPLSFLGARQKIPPLPDSPEPSSLSKSEEHPLVAEIPFGIKDSPVDDVEQDPLPPQVNSAPKNSPTVNSSPTAVPFASRRNSRFRPPLQSRTKTRPRSIGFSSSEFRPLYLVARNTPRQEPSIENYYSLPSSHSTSRTSSIQDPQENDFERGPNQIDALDLFDPIKEPHSEGRELLIDTQHSLQGLDLLDSAQPTPTAHSFQAAGQRDASPQAKTMHDLDSTLVAIPLSPSPSFTNFKHDLSSTSQYRGQELIRDRIDLSSDHDLKNNLPEYPFEQTEDLPPLPSSRALSPGYVSEPNSLEPIIQPIIHSKHEFELPDDLPPLPSSPALALDLDDKLDEPNENPQPSLRSIEYDFERPKDSSDLSSSRPLSPDPCIEPAEQQFISPSEQEFDIPEDFPSLPSSRVSSPELAVELEKMKTTPQPTRDIGIPGDLSPLPRSRTSTPELDVQIDQSIQLPQLIRGFESPRNLPAMPSSHVVSPDNDFESPPEPKTITRRAYSFQAPDDLPTLPSSRASSPDLDAELRNRVSIRLPVNEFEQFEDFPALPSSRASSPDAGATYQLELKRGAAPQPMFGLERSEILPPLPSSRASSLDFDADFNVEPSKDLPALPSSRASSPDFYVCHDVETKMPLEPTLEFPLSENLPVLPSSRASSPDADIFHDTETKIPLELTLESHGSEDLQVLPVSRATSLEAYSTHDIKTRITLEPTFDFQGSEDRPRLPSGRGSSPKSDTYHDVENKTPLQPTNLIPRLEDLPALPPSRAPSPNSSNETELINNKLGLKLMAQEKIVPNLDAGLVSDDVTGAINADIAESSKAPIEKIPQSPDLLTSGGNSLDDAKETEHSLQRQTYVESADLLSTPEKGADTEPTLRLQASLSSTTLTKGMTGDEVVAVMAAVAEGGANTQVKRSATNSKKARRNQKKAKQGDRAQASISEELDRASAQQQEGMEDDLSSQSFPSKDSNMPSGENLVDATSLSIPGLGTELSRGENIQIEENAPPVKKCKKGKKNKKQAVQIGPSPKSVVTDDSSPKPGPKAAHAAVLKPIAGDFDMEGAQMGGPSVEIVDQKSPKAASQSETPPEAISLPIDDDLELLEALSRSPSVRPSDRSSSPDSFPETTALPTDNHQKTALQTERPPEAVKLPLDADVDLVAPTHYVETTDRGRYTLAQPKNNEDHEPSAMVAELHNSALKPDIVPDLVVSTARDDLDQVEASPQSALLEKTDETSQEQGQMEENLSEMPNTPVTESLKPDLEPNLAAQSIALPPNDDLDLLEASSPKPSTELTHTQWLEKPEPLINESPESVPAQEITSRAGPLPDNDDLGLQKASPQSPSIGSTEQRSYRPKLGEFKRSGEIEPFTQLSFVLAPEFIALPSDSDPDLLESSPRMPSKVPQLNVQLDESRSDAEASSLRSPETPIIPAEDITAMADYDLDVVEQDLPSPPTESMKYFSLAEEPIAKLPQDVCEIRSYPETVALPVDDDLDLLDALPPSPPTDSQPELIDEPSLRSLTEIFGPDFTPDIFVSRAAKGFRPPSAPPTSSFAGQMPTIPEEVPEQEVSPESFTLPPDDDLDLVEEDLASPLADPMVSQLGALEEPNFHSSRELNEIEVTPHINPDKELDLLDALPPSPLSKGIDEPPEEILETEVNPETIELPDDEDLDLLEALPPSPTSDASQVPQVGSITLPGTLSSISPAEQISRSPKELLERNVNPEISEIPADKELDSRRAIPPSSPIGSPLNPVKEQNFSLSEDLPSSEITPEPITLPADKDFDLLEALPPNTWAGSQQSPGKEASSTSFTNIPEAKNVTQEIRDYHDLAKALPPSASGERVQYQPDQQGKLRSRSLKEPSEPEITPQAMELPYDDDLELLGSLPSSPLASPTPELEERITKSLESERVTPRSPLSRSVESKDYHSEPAEELASKSLEPEVNLEASKLPVGDSLDPLDTLPPSPSTELTEHETRSMEEPVPVSPELATSTVACADGDPGLLESGPQIFSADHQTRSVKEPIPTLPERAPSTVACADGDPGLLESRPEILSAGHQTQSLEDPIPELLEPARSTVACADGDLGVPETRPKFFSIDQSSQQTDLLDERISRWQNELVAESQLPPESIRLPSDGDSEVLAALPPSPIKSVIIDEVELRPLDKASQPREASPHALEPLKEIYFQVLPKDLPLPADDGLDFLEAQPESPLPEPQVVPKDFPLPTDDDLDLLDALPESPLSESQVVPEDLPLPTDDDLDLLEALPESPLSESQVVPEDLPLPTDDNLDLLETLPESPLPESQVVPKNAPLRTDGDLELSEALPESHSSESDVVPEDLPLPTDDDLDLLEGLPGSPLPEFQVAPKDFPPPTNNDLDLLEQLSKSTLSESRVVPEDMPLPTDIDLGLLEAPPNSSLLEFLDVPKDFPLPTDDDLDLLDTLPESPSLRSSNIYSDKLETQNLEVKEHDPDAHHNLIIPGFLEPEDAPENLQSPANDDLDLETSSQSSLARSINPENTDRALLKEEVKEEVAEGFEDVTDNANKDTDKVKPTKSIGAALSEVLMKEESNRATSEEPEMLDNDGDFSKKIKRNTTKGKRIQVGSSKLGLILEEVEPPKASVATLPLDGSNEASESSENLVRNAEVEGSSEHQTIEDEWPKEPKKKGKKGKKGQKAEGNSPLKGSTETTKPLSPKSMMLDPDFEDSQAQAVTEDEGQNETKKKGKKGKKSKDKKSIPSTRTPGLPPMTSPGIDAAQLKAFEHHLDHPADTKDEASLEDKIEEARVKQTSSSEDAETTEVQPGQPESEENVSEITLQDPQAEDELPRSNKKRARKEKKRKSKLTGTYREGSDSEKAETSHALSEPRSDLVDQLVESRGTEAVEEPRQDQDFTETMGLELEQVEPRQVILEEALPEATIDDGPAEPVRNGYKGKKVMNSKQGLEDDATTLAEVTRNELEPTQTMPELESELPTPDEVRPKEDDDQHIGAQQIEPENIAPDFSFAKSIESGQVEPDHLESRLADLEEPQLAQSHLAEIKDIASGQPKSQLMEENPAEISLTVEPEPIKKENSTFNADSPAREIKGSTPTPQEPDYTEPIPNKVAAPVDNTTRKTPSSIFDFELPLDLQAAEHLPNPEKDHAATNIMTPTSAAENNLLDTKEYLPFVPEPATLTQLPPSTDQHPSILENSPFTAAEPSFTEPLEKSPVTADQPSVREDDSVAETHSSKKPSVTISNPVALRPLSADKYPVPVEELSIIGSSDKALVPLEEPIDIDSLSSGKPLISPEEIPLIDVPSVDGYLATAKELASFESHHSPDHVKEPPVKDLDVSPADKSLIGFEEPLFRNMASPDKCLPVPEDPSVMEVLSPDNALVTLEEPAVIDAPSSDKSLVHVEEPSVTKSGPPEKSAIPVQEPTTTESPASGKSPLTMEEFSVITAEEPTNLDASLSVAKEHLSDIEMSSIDPENPTCSASEPPLNIQKEPISEQNTDGHSTVEDLTPISLRDIESLPVIEIPAKLCQEDLPSNTNQVPEDILPQDESAKAKKSKKGKKSKETVTPEQELTVSDSSSAKIKQETKSQNTDEDSPLLKNIIAVPNTKKGKDKKALNGTKQEDEPHPADLVPIASEEILAMSSKAGPDQFDDDLVASAVLEKQDYESAPLGEDTIVPIKRGKKGKKGSNARQQADDDLAQPEEAPIITPEDPSTFLEKQYDELKQPEDDTITPESLSADLKEQGEIDESIAPVKKTKKGKKGSESRKQGAVDKLDQPEEDPITSQNLSTGPKRQEVELDQIEEDPNATKDLSGVPEKQDGFDQPAAPLEKGAKGKEGKNDRKREVDEFDQPEHSSAVLDELQAKNEDPLTPEDHIAVSEKQEDELQLEEVPIAPEDLHTVSGTQEDELQPKEDPITPEDFRFISEKQDELQLRENRITPHDLFATPDTREDELEIKENFLDGLKIKEDVLQIREGTITPENLSAALQAQEDELVTITPENFPVGLETQEDQVDQNPIAPDRVTPEDPSDISNKQCDRYEDPIAPNPATPEDLSAAPEKREDEPEQLDEGPTKRARKGKKGKKGSKARKQEFDEPEQREDDSTTTEKQDQVDGPIGADRVTPDNFSTVPAIQGDQLEETPIATNPITPEDLSFAVPESQIYEIEQLEDDPIAPENSSAVKKAKKGRKGKKREFFDKPYDLVTSEDHSAPSEKQEAEPDQLGKKTKNGKKGKSKRQLLDYLPGEDPVTPEDTSATELKQTDQLDRPEEDPVISEDLSAVQTEDDPVISRDLSAIHKKQINPHDQPDNPIISEGLSALIVDKLNQTQEDPITSQELSAPTIGKLDHPMQESIHPEEPYAVPTTKTIDENTEDPAEYEPVVSEDIFPPLKDYELDQTVQEYIASADVVVPPKAKIKKGKKEKHVDRLGPADQTFLSPGDASASQDELFDRLDQSNIASEESAAPEEQSAEIPLKRKSKKGKKSKQYENFDRSDKGPITPEETIASPENIPNVPLSAEGSQDDESIQKSLAPAAPGDTDTPQEDIYAIPKNNRGKNGRKAKQGDVMDQSNAAGRVASGDGLTLQDDFPNSNEGIKQDARLDQTELDPLSPRDLPEPLFSKNETQHHERNEPGSEPSDEASVLQEDFPEIDIAKRDKKDKRGKKGSQTDTRAIPEETIATDANAGGSELLPDDTRDLALEPISQPLSENIPKPQAEPQHEETKEAEAVQQKSLSTQTPVAEDSHMDNSLDVSLGVHAEEATLQGHLVKPQAEREFEDAGNRGEDNSLLIEGYGEATHSDLSRQHPRDQREQLAEAVQALQTPVALDSMPSDVPIQLQSQSPPRELADLDVEHTDPTEILTSYNANPSVDSEKGDERRLIPEPSQIVHPSDGIFLSSTPSLVTDSAEAQESKGLAEVEQQKSPGLEVIPSDIDLNRSTYFESLTEPENFVPELPPIDPAFGKSTPVEELSAPEWGLKPTKKSKKEKKSKKKALDSDSLNTGEILERGSADVSEVATIAGDLDLKPTEGPGENLPEITLTEAGVEKSTPVEEQGVPEWVLTPTRRSKEKKSKKKALNSDSSGTRAILEPKSADNSKAATLTGDLDLKLTKKLEEDLPQITLAEAVVDKSTSVEEQSVPEWGLTPVGKSKKEKKSKKALDSDSSGTREILEVGPSDLCRDIDLKPFEGLIEPQQDVPELLLAKANAAEELSVPETDLKLTKKSKKEKKSKTKALDIDSLTTRETLERKQGDIPKYFTRDVDFKPSDELAEPEQDMPEQLQIDKNAKKCTTVEGSAITELRSRPSKKGKEDKKSKGRASDLVFTEEMLDPAPSERTAMEAFAEQNLPELSNTEGSIPNDDSAIPKSGFKPSKKSKKDKKSKDRATASGSLVPEASELLIKTLKEQILPKILNADESNSIEDSKRPESGPLPSERSKKDKKSKNKPIVDDSIVTEETFEPTVSEIPTGIPEEQIVPELSPTKENKKGKETGKQNLEIDRGPSSAIGDNVERGPAETPLDTSAEPTIPEHEPSTKRKKSKQSEKQDYELGANFTPLDTEPVPQNNQQVAEAVRSAGSADHVDKKEDSRSIDPTQHESERHQTSMPEREISLDEREQIHNSPLLDTHDEIGTDNISDKMAGFKSEAPTPEGSTPGESTPGESTPAESVNRDSVVPQSDSPRVTVILPVQNDSRDTEARALETQYPEFVQDESQPHLEVEKHSPGREIEAQQLSRKPSDSATESTFNISVEVDSSYGVSISTPLSKRKRSLAVSTPARNDEEIFPDSTRNIESLQTEEQPFQDPGEPSPVSPTTKERSSALFQSSPSTREDFINRRPEPESPLHDPAEVEDVDYGNRDMPDWTQPADFSMKKSRITAPTPIDLNIWKDEKRGPSDSRSPVSPVSPITPIGFREERSTSRSPFVSDISDRSRLNTIVEYSPKESPLHKKSRSVSDVGSPERGVKFRRRSAVPQQTSQARMRSPLNPESTARLTAPFEDLTYRLSWPKVDEDNHTVDLERSGSRERRSPSGASVGSVESINAIIKTPDVKSSGTPPLRRTDRSVSGDLREAHKKGGARKLAKRKEAEGQLDIAIPSSSTYDPTKDKGKRRVDDMAAVYVSITFHFRIIIYQDHRQLMRS